MKKKISFYKDGDNWYADIPLIAKRHNIMVAGADTFLEKISKGHKRVTLTVSTEKGWTDNVDGMYYLIMTKHDFWGGSYNVYDGFNKNPVHQLWLCNVTHFALGRHPKRIIIKTIERSE